MRLNASQSSQLSVSPPARVASAGRMPLAEYGRKRTAIRKQELCSPACVQAPEVEQITHVVWGTGTELVRPIRAGR